MVTPSKSLILTLTDDLLTLRPMCQSLTSDKLKLHSLNCRLTGYIERVRFLEMENGRLIKKLRIIRDWSNIKSMYKRELANVREALDETAFDKSKLEINAARLIEENEYYKRTLEMQCNKLNIAHENEQYYRNIQNKYNSVCLNYEKIVNNANEMQMRIDQLNRQLHEVNKALEIETLARIDSENVAQQKLCTELAFHNQIHVEKTTSTLDRSKLKISDEQHKLHTFWMEYDENQCIRSQLNDYREKIDELRAENDKLKLIIADSEAQLRAEKRRTCELEDEIVHSRQKLAQFFQIFQNSMKNVEVLFDKKLIIHEKQHHLHVSKSNNTVNVSSTSLVQRYHRTTSKMNGQRSNQRIESIRSCHKRKHTYIGGTSTATINQSTGRSRIVQSFQRFKTKLKLLEFGKIKEMCTFFEFGKKTKKNYLQK